MMKKVDNFEMLYRQNYEAIYKFCFRILASHENARDLTQETFVKLHGRISKSDAEIENTKAWLYKVAGNLCLNALNTKNRRNKIENLLDDTSIETSNPETILIHNEKIMRVRKGIESLPPNHQLLILMYQDGLSYREMSEATGIKLNSVGKTLWRIIDKLSTTIHKECKDTRTCVS